MDGGVFQKIRRVVASVPEGKVVSYGQVAKLAGVNDARLVGWAIHKNTDSVALPCHRVIRSDGTLADGYGMGGWQEQKAKLLEEGVEFIRERKVDLKKHQWKNF